MSVLIDLLVHVLHTVFNPLVVGAAMLLGFLAPRAAVTRIGTACVAAAVGLIEALAAASLQWSLAVLAASALAGLFVAELVLVVALPTVLAALGAARWLLRLGRR